MTRRKDIKDILADPVLRAGLIESSTDFICKVEGIRPESFTPMLITNFTATGRNLYTLYQDGRNVRAWTRLKDVPADLIPLAADARRIAVTSDQYNALCTELVK